jgi:hypothetical protein
MHARASTITRIVNMISRTRVTIVPSLSFIIFQINYLRLNDIRYQNTE